MRLVEPLFLGARTASSRVLFGPIVTNLGDDQRTFTARHLAFYAARARGGAGIVVTEGASVHPSDWPYERAPLADRCGDGWAAIAAGCHDHGALLVASLDHAGGQGSSAHSQRELWAPSAVPEVNTREVPKWMEDDDIAAVVDGFGHAAKLAADAGCDGVEVNAGQHSLIRQFLSGLTNHRGDQWADRAHLADRVLQRVRAEAGPDLLVGLRLSCDELAPWAGITPDQAPALAARLVAGGVDYLVVTRGSIYTADKTRADWHEPAGATIALARAVRGMLARHGEAGTAVFAQGSIVDVHQAEAALHPAGGAAAVDGVEMTRAMLADPDLVAKVRGGRADRVRPCTRCNQTCQVRDPRNPIITCVGEPSTGHETDDPDWYAPAAPRRSVTVLGAGPAGLEVGRVAALRGHAVTIVDTADRVGGIAACAGPHEPLVRWLAAEAQHAGASIRTGWSGEPPAADVVVQCTGSVAGEPTYTIDTGATIVDVAELRRGRAALPAEGDVVIHDPIGGPIGVALAEELGRRAILVTPDHIAGNELSRSGDLAPANVRLAQAGVRIERRTILRHAGADHVTVEHRFSGERRDLHVAAVVDCGFRLPGPPIERAALAAGDCVAPRTVHEAILEGRRAALAVDRAPGRPR